MEIQRNKLIKVSFMKIRTNILLDKYKVQRKKKLTETEREKNKKINIGLLYLIQKKFGT